MDRNMDDQHSYANSDEDNKRKTLFPWDHFYFFQALCFWNDLLTTNHWHTNCPRLRPLFGLEWCESNVLIISQLSQCRLISRCSVVTEMYQWDGDVMSS